LGIFAGIAAGKTANEITKSFIAGAGDILSAALVVGLAGGIVVILEDGKIIDPFFFICRKPWKIWERLDR
jgi:uncharacterized ion transporter superfamily protein YfcC